MRVVQRGGVEADFIFGGLDKRGSPRKVGFEAEHLTGGLKDGQTFPYFGEFVPWPIFYFVF